MRISDWSSDVCSSDLFKRGVSEEEHQIGAVTGLAWTEVGGELLTIETVTVPGKGAIRTTGKLGEVMNESVQAAFSYVKARSRSDERRVGKGGVSTGRYRRSTAHYKINKII